MSSAPRYAALPALVALGVLASLTLARTQALAEAKADLAAIEKEIKQ